MDNSMNTIVRIETTEYEKILKKMHDELTDEDNGVFVILEEDPVEIELRPQMMKVKRMAIALGLPSKVSLDVDSVSELADNVHAKILENLREVTQNKIKSAEKMTGNPDYSDMLRDDVYGAGGGNPTKKKY